MKKNSFLQPVKCLILSLITDALFSISYSQTVSTTVIDFDHGPFGQINSSCGAYSSCDLGAAGRTVSGILVKATHGCPGLNVTLSSGPVDLLRLDALMSDSGIPFGSGVVLQYSFKKNYKYIITTSGSNSGVLQMRLTNDPIYASDLCTYRTPQVDISLPSNPAIFSTLSQIEGIVTEFTPDQCYNYLWLSLLLGSGTSSSCHMHKMTIEEINLLSISGSSVICSGSQQYTLDVQGSTVTTPVSWQSVGPNIATIPSNGNPITVTKTGNGVLSLIANTNVCGVNQTAAKQISFGIPQAPVNIVGINYPLAVSQQEILELEVDPSNLPVNYSWEAVGGTIAGASNMSHVTVVVDQCPPQLYNGYLNVYVTFSNACGASPTYGEWTYVDCSTGGGPEKMSKGNKGEIVSVSSNIIFPNPAKDYIQYNYSGKETTTCFILNISGTIVKTLIAKPGINKINISDLKSGIYILQIIDKIGVIKRKLVKM